MAPTTDSGRLFTIFYALYGIGILGSFLTTIGGAVIDAGHAAMAETEARAKKRLLAMFSTSDSATQQEPKAKTLCQEITMATILEAPWIILLFIFAILLGLPEGRSIISSLYFAVVTALTIGFGDLYPKSQINRALCVIYLPFSVCVFGQVLTKIASVSLNAKARQADEAFLQRELALRDLKAMDVDGDGKVTFGEFLSFILVAMDKVSQEEIDEVRSYFDSLDADKNGYLEKADLVKLATEGTDMQLTDSMRRMGANAAVERH